MHIYSTRKPVGEKYCLCYHIHLIPEHVRFKKAIAFDYRNIIRIAVKVSEDKA